MTATLTCDQCRLTARQVDYSLNTVPPPRVESFIYEAPFITVQKPDDKRYPRSGGDLHFCSAECVSQYFGDFVQKAAVVEKSTFLGIRADQDPV